MPSPHSAQYGQGWPPHSELFEAVMDKAFAEGKEETHMGFFSGKHDGEAAGWCGFPLS